MLEIKTFSPKSHKIKCLIYGASWTWKTTFWWSAKNVIFASSEDWLLSIADKKIPFAKIETLENLQQLRDFLRDEEHEFETLVIDSITDINERIKKSIEVKTWKSMEKNMWAELSDKIKGILFDIKNIDMNIIIISQEKFEKDWENIQKIIPSLNWKLATEICYFMDIVWYIFIDKEWSRKLITSPSEKYLSKDRTKRIWNDTELNFEKWTELVSDIHSDEEEILYTIMTKTEKELIKKVAQSESYKKDLMRCETIECLEETYKGIDKRLITITQQKEINTLTTELKAELPPKK